MHADLGWVRSAHALRWRRLSLSSRSAAPLVSKTSEPDAAAALIASEGRYVEAVSPDRQVLR
jgi:hypothetical protein